MGFPFGSYPRALSRSSRSITFPLKAGSTTTPYSAFFERTSVSHVHGPSVFWSVTRFPLATTVPDSVDRLATLLAPPFGDAKSPECSIFADVQGEDRLADVKPVTDPPRGARPRVPWSSLTALKAAGLVAAGGASIRGALTATSND